LGGDRRKKVDPDCYSRVANEFAADAECKNFRPVLPDFFMLVE
jgi:hypothetical protein